MISRILLTICLIGGLVACGSGVEAPPADTPIKNIVDSDIQFEQLGRGVNHNQAIEGSDITVVTLMSFTNQATLNTFWASLKAGTALEPEAPQIDFSSKMVLVVMTPFYTSGGHVIQIEELFMDSGEIYLSVILTVPGAECMVTQSYAQPFEIIEIDLTDAPISMLLTELVEDCM